MKLVMSFLVSSSAFALAQTPQSAKESTQSAQSNLNPKVKIKNQRKKVNSTQNSIPFLLSGNISVYEQKQASLYTKYSSLSWCGQWANFNQDLTLFHS